MSHRRTTPKVFAHAQELLHNLTEAESRLWVYLRSHRLEGIGFRRQHAIGPYIVDFCAPRVKLVIELDGCQHLDQHVYDQERTICLEESGYRVLRFWNNEVMDEIEAVLRVIQEAVRK